MSETFELKIALVTGGAAGIDPADGPPYATSLACRLPNDQDVAGQLIQHSFDSTTDNGPL
jgi:hypothetical protein